MGSKVIVQNDNFEKALRTFKKKILESGKLIELKEKEFYEKPTSIRKRKAAAAVKRYAKKVQRESRKMERLY